MRYLIFVLLFFTSLAFATHLNWELVKEGTFYSYIYRLEVPGGWLIKSRVYGGCSVIFYPDEKHEWKIKHESE